MERSSERIAETFQPGAASLGQQRLFFGPRLLEAEPRGPRDPDRFEQPCLVFGLAGIVVNDSIILVTFYKELKQPGTPWRARRSWTRPARGCGRCCSPLPVGCASG